jgi:hypothetical protein
MSDNPPAFPFQDGPVLTPGMTLRDYFAGQALMGIGCNHNAVARMNWATDPHAERAELAYALADAMLAERKKGGAS